MTFTTLSFPQIADEQLPVAPLQHVWVTRCPVPTATGLSIKRGTLAQVFAARGIEVSTLQDAPKELAVHHMDHRLPALFREGGNVPALAARAQGSPSKLIGLTWIDEWQVIIVQPDSDIAEPAQLKGLRVALPAYAETRGSSIFRAMSLQGFNGALAIAGLKIDDVSFVEVPARGEPVAGDERGASSFWSGLDALVAGDVDAVYVKGASAVEAARKRGLKVGIDLDRYDDVRTRVNNGTPRPITVHEDLLNHHFEVVVDFLAEILDTADWAASNLDDVLKILESETVAGADSVSTAYRNNFHLSLHPSLDPARIALLEQQKNFLWLHGFLEHDIDIAEWIDPRPLQEALKRREQRLQSTNSRQIAAG